jgi:hypothetical protein
VAELLTVGIAAVVRLFPPQVVLAVLGNIWLRSRAQLMVGMRITSLPANMADVDLQKKVTFYDKQ